MHLRHALLALVCSSLAVIGIIAAPVSDSYWRVNDIRPGMKGIGRTVMKGAKVETFNVEVLGVLRNTSPGRDMVLCRLAGLGLENTGVIAGMSGSPVWIDGKLLGAVAYAWPYGKEPIAGVTPFVQMRDYSAPHQRNGFVGPPAPNRIRFPITIGSLDFDTVTVAQSFDNHASETGLWMMPLKTPLVATGFSANSLRELGERLGPAGLVPLQGGAVAGSVAEEHKDVAIVPGGSLSVALVTGDFDLSGIGTVTHVEGHRVWGWGHPFLGIGGCDLPMMTGFVHTIYPRQSVSFKIGSPLRMVGAIDADVSTCVAGRLGSTPDMLPVEMTVKRESAAVTSNYRVAIVRQRQLLPNLLSTVLTNSIDAQGELPDEMTAHLRLTIELEGHDPIILDDTVASGAGNGNRAIGMLYGPVPTIVGQIVNTTHQPARIKRVNVETTVAAGRRSADIEGVEVERETYAPGQTVRATVYVRPNRENVRAIPVSLKLPLDLPDGAYQATVTDQLSSIRQEFRGKPHLNNPENTGQLLAGLRMLAGAKRTTLTIRLPIPSAGVALNGQELPDLPPGVAARLSQTRRSTVSAVSGAVTERYPLPWVISGGDTIRFTVSRNKS
jgi:hypothetical protein